MTIRSHSNTDSPENGRGEGTVALSDVSELGLGHALQLAADHFTGLLKNVSDAKTEETLSIRELTRALVLARATDGFEPVVRDAIRHYREVYSEVLRFRFKKGVPTKLRADILAGFERLLARAKEDLELLSVQASFVPVGEPLDLAKHQVVRSFRTASVEKVGTVARCVMPEFAWITPFGKERFEPAEVWAFTEHSPRPQPTAKPSSNGRAVVTSG